MGNYDCTRRGMFSVCFSKFLHFATSGLTNCPDRPCRHLVFDVNIHCNYKNTNIVDNPLKLGESKAIHILWIKENTFHLCIHFRRKELFIHFDLIPPCNLIQWGSVFPPQLVSLEFVLSLLPFTVKLGQQD